MPKCRYCWLPRAGWCGSNAGGVMVTRVLRLGVTVAVMGAIIAVLGMPGVASAASGPVCGNPADTAAHCYVQAQQASPNGQPDLISMVGVFTVPSKLAVKAPAYSIAEISLGYYPVQVELGWIVAPGQYHGSTAPIFSSISGGRLAFRRTSARKVFRRPLCSRNARPTITCSCRRNTRQA